MYVRTYEYKKDAKITPFVNSYERLNIMYVSKK